MAFGKILGFAALGVGAVALAPFTGGGSLVGATSLAASLGTAGAVAGAVGAGTAGAVYGASQARKEEEEERERNEEIAKLNLKADKFEKDLIEAIKSFEGDKEYFNYIIATMAMGMSIAASNGEIHPNEIEELGEFVGGLASSNYPQHIKDNIEELYNNPPNFSTAVKYLEKVNPSNFDGIAEMLEIVMEADGIEHKEQLAFIAAFDMVRDNIRYIPENDDFENDFLLDIQYKIS